MILQALVAYAEREGLDPLWRRAPVNAAVDLDAAGNLLGVTPLGDPKRGLDMLIPMGPKRSGKSPPPALLVDNARYALGVPARDKKEPDVTEKAVEDAKDRFFSFESLLRTEAVRCDAPELKALLTFLAARKNTLATSWALADRDWSGDERIVFRVDGKFVHELPKVRAWLDATLGSSSGALGRCLVTGEATTIARLHPTIRRVPSGQTSGTSLVSFNNPAFLSHGLDQGANAQVGENAARKYGAALNDLLEGTPDRRFKQGLPLGDDSVILFWTREKNAAESILIDLLAPPKDDGAALHAAEAALQGRRSAPLDPTAFYALTIAGSAARVVVRDWIESTAGVVLGNLDRYLDDLALGRGERQATAIWELLGSLNAAGGAAPPPSLSARLVRAALLGHPFPLELLGLALRRLRLPPGDRESRKVLHTRVALVKATLLRLPTPVEVSVSLDEKNTRVAYLLGRLFATLERLQGDAQGDINATIRDRYFGSASSTPAVVFPRLLRVSVHHASKSKSGGWFEKIKTDIIAKLPADAPFPTTLTLTDQGLFAVGYYHQRDMFFQKRADAEPAADAD